MTKTPDEIKKGLRCPAWVRNHHLPCSECDYHGQDKPPCAIAVHEDAIALIEQLEAEKSEQAEKIRVLESRNNTLYHTILGVMHFVDKWLDVPAYDPDEDLNGTTAVGRASHAREIALQAIEQLEAERDAAVACIPRVCKYCKHDGPLNAWGESECEFDSVFPNGCLNGNTRWEWRGVQKEDSDDGKE